MVLASEVEGRPSPPKLIERAVGAAYRKAEPPAELQTAWQCQRWGTLPEAGGIYDQDDTLLYRMGMLDNIYRTVMKINSSAGAEIHKLSTSERLLWRWLMEEGFM